LKNQGAKNQGAKEGKMPLKLSTTIGKIQNIPNSKNTEIVNEFLEYMRNNGCSNFRKIIFNYLSYSSLF
jgi:flagellar motor switch protein FliG